MAFGLYLHSPFCLQQCPYCDFTTKPYQGEQVQKNYASLLIKEIQQRGKWKNKAPITSLYWGGGTPSLLDPETILAIHHEFVNQGFEFTEDCEMTLEINPGTIDQKKLDELLQIGFNRFSVGIQTFNPSLLQLIGRQHSPTDSENTLTLLKSNNVNYSADFLYALPKQSFPDFLQDFFKFMEYSPAHLSCYILTLPENHKLNQNRAPDDEQAEMIDFLSGQLKHLHYEQYEISNFAKAGHKSRHNLNAWLGHEYWGLGISAHSYFNDGTYGIRFWNPNTIEKYKQQLENDVISKPFDCLPEYQKESLNYYESLSDYCHTHLRISSGLIWGEIKDNWGEAGLKEVKSKYLDIKNSGLVVENEKGISLSPSGKLMSNQVIQQFFFSSSETNSI